MVGASTQLTDATASAEAALTLEIKDGWLQSVVQHCFERMGRSGCRSQALDPHGVSRPTRSATALLSSTLRSPSHHDLQGLPSKSWPDLDEHAGF